MPNELVLVVDDDPSIVNLLMEDLLAEGFEVITAFDGASAVDLARARRPRVIVMDVNMPGISGIESVAHLRSLPETGTIPVILLTGEATPALPQTTGGFITHVEKPVDLERLNSLIKKALKPS